MDSLGKYIRKKYHGGRLVTHAGVVHHSARIPANFNPVSSPPEQLRGLVCRHVFCMRCIITPFFSGVQHLILLFQLMEGDLRGIADER